MRTKHLLSGYLDPFAKAAEDTSTPGRATSWSQIILFSHPSSPSALSDRAKQATILCLRCVSLHLATSRGLVLTPNKKNCFSSPLQDATRKRSHGVDATPTIIATMSTLHSGAATVPRDFRYHQPGDSEPRTPEPFCTANNEGHPPSPPRPRFRIKRRHASQLTAPTQQFLASVAAADVPIPSIEIAEPEEDNEEPMQMAQYPFTPRTHTAGDYLDYQKVRGAQFPPKTPEPESASSLSSEHYPDWTIDSTYSSDESSPECEYSRPSTARSTHTSASIFSRISFTSEDAQCMSPELDSQDAHSKSCDDAPAPLPSKPSGAKSKGKFRKAPWTMAMSDHLWSTYLMYCHDPKVTPFRAGRNGIPPHGVCLRVAREAKRSWKGSRTHLVVGDKSGSSTPTAESSSVFIQWPHTCAATRARLRELCRGKGASSATRTHHCLSHSPTPFGRTAVRHWNRRTTPFRSPSIFSSRDMNMSLSMCTADSLQPTGQLAQLTSSALDTALDETPAALTVPKTPEPALETHAGRPLRLASPFMTKSYGPSSSSGLGSAFSLRSSFPQRQTCTLEPRRSLQSPLRLPRSRSNTLQKRRSRQTSNEVRRNKRPSLGSDLWTEPAAALGHGGINGSSTSRPSLEFSSTSSKRHDDLFVPRTNVEDLFVTANPLQQQTDGAISGLAPPTTQAPRLGSPFSASTSSLSFPNRLSQPTNLFSAIRRPFATIQQPTDDSSGLMRGNLASRLTYINERLREFRRRDHQRRRSESPL